MCVCVCVGVSIWALKSWIPLLQGSGWGLGQLGQSPLPGRDSAWKGFCLSLLIPAPPSPWIPAPSSFSQASPNHGKNEYLGPAVHGRKVIVLFFLFWDSSCSGLLIPRVEHLLCARSGAKVCNRSSYHGLFTDAPFTYEKSEANPHMNQKMVGLGLGPESQGCWASSQRGELRSQFPYYLS